MASQVWEAKLVSILWLLIQHFIKNTPMLVLVAFTYIETNMTKDICINGQVDKYLNF